MFAVLFPAPAVNASPEDGKKAIVVVMNAVGLEELLAAKAPNFDRLMTSGALGLMNARAGSSENIGNFYLSLGAGARADAGRFGSLAFNALERTPDAFYSGLLTGKDLSRQNNNYSLSAQAVFNLSARDAATQSFKYRNNVTPGLLGEALRAGAKKTGVIGNADTLEASHREIALITMDGRGNTDYGDVSRDLCLTDERFPGGLRTDYGKLAKRTADALRNADLVAVELGDTARLSVQRPMMSKQTNTGGRRRAVAAADAFIGLLSKKIDPTNTLMVIVSPQPQKDALVDRDYLTPIIVAGLGPGVVTSNTTKRPGLVANLDVAPTILDYLGLPIPVEMAGNPIKAAPMDDIAPYLEKRHSQIVALRRVRSPFLTAYFLFLLVGLSGALALARLGSLGRAIDAKYRATLKMYLLFLLAMPLGSLIQVPLDGANGLVAAGSLMAATFIVALFGFVLSRKFPPAPFLLIGGLTSLALSYDALTGTFLSEKSFFGSDLISGGRFYGLGNTYMGIMVGAAILALAAAYDMKIYRSPIPAGFLMLVVAVIIGHPGIGANVGGLLTGVATALFFAGILWGEKVTWKTVAVNFALFSVLTAAVLRVDFPGQQTKSHAGKAMAAIQAKGVPVVGDIIIRKLTQNINGALSFYGFVLMCLVLLAVALRWALKSDSIFGSFALGFSGTVKGFKTMIWAAVVAGVLNDTGAVAAAAILLYLLIPLFVLALDPANLKAEGALSGKGGA